MKYTLDSTKRILEIETNDIRGNSAGGQVEQLTMVVAGSNGGVDDDVVVTCVEEISCCSVVDDVSLFSTGVYTLL